MIKFIKNLFANKGNAYIISLKDQFGITEHIITSAGCLEEAELKARELHKEFTDDIPEVVGYERGDIEWE